MVIKMLSEQRRRKDEHGETFNKEMKYVRKCRKEVTDLNHTIIELKKIQYKGLTTD